MRPSRPLPRRLLLLVAQLVPAAATVACPEQQDVLLMSGDLLPDSLKYSTPDAATCCAACALLLPVRSKALKP
jgi:hypothetical protein